MPKVKCLYCGAMLERDSDKCVKANKTRYAHRECAEIYVASMSEEERDKKALEQYICKVFSWTEISDKAERQIEKYHVENRYTYSGMLKALIYHFEIQGGNVNAANGGVGILPYIYDQALNYYYDIWKRQQQNEGFSAEQHEQKTVVIKIKPPVRKRGGKRRLFDIEGSLGS